MQSSITPIHVSVVIWTRLLLVFFIYALRALLALYVWPVSRVSGVPVCRGPCSIGSEQSFSWISSWAVSGRGSGVEEESGSTVGYRRRQGIADSCSGDRLAVCLFKGQARLLCFAFCCLNEVGEESIGGVGGKGDAGKVAQIVPYGTNIRQHAVDFRRNRSLLRLGDLSGKMRVSLRETVPATEMNSRG